MNKLKKLLTICFIISVGNLMAQEVEPKVSEKGSLKKTNKVYLADFNLTQYIQMAASQTAAGVETFAKVIVNFGGVEGTAY
ncbi:hypothetical protein A5893_01785 [Pedobacter psychrophilus]|uniref:Uncharacterized protein n=1 Tax=Pedobacter psychrophilus TaxID=1826909 RepID=A0A179DLU0_9SPHI|nr:hypothetical protein [Pedobacter psychrophilus]OAQ41874.1 hypothetical protein A5893_01785 [Pedobacter psychrophilus]